MNSVHRWHLFVPGAGRSDTGFAAQFRPARAVRGPLILEFFEVGLVFQHGDAFAKLFQFLLLGEGVNTL